MDEFKMSDNEILAKAIQSGIINVDDIAELIDMNERKKYINMHLERYKTWIGTNGKYYTYVPDEYSKNGRKMIKRATEQALEDAIVKFYKTKEKEPTIRQMFNNWLNDKYEYGEISKQTYDKYLTSYKRFFQNEHVSFDLEKIKYVTDESLERFIKTNISKLNLSRKAYSDMRTLIYGIFKYAKKRHFTTISITNFMGDLDLPKNMFTKKVVKKENEVFSEEEIPQIIEYLEKQGDIHSLGLSLAFQTGVRVGELSALKFSDVNCKTIHGTKTVKHYLSIERTEIKVKDENDKWIHLVRDYPKTEAGVRNIIITDKTVKLLSKIRLLNPFGEYMFMYEGFRISGHAFNKKLTRVCKTLGINKRSMHKIRKTYGTTLIDNDVDDSVIAEMMGHSDITTTRKYYYYSNKAESTKVDQVTKALSGF